MRHPDGTWAGFTYEWNHAADRRDPGDGRSHGPRSTPRAGSSPAKRSACSATRRRRPLPRPRDCAAQPRLHFIPANRSHRERTDNAQHDRHAHARDHRCRRTTEKPNPSDTSAPLADRAGAGKDRWIGLPNGVNIAVQGGGDWEPPNGTVLVKHFRFGNQLIETRLFMRHPDGVWARIHLPMERAQTEATRVSGGGTANIGGQTWIFPSEAQCMQCHTRAAGFSLGLETAQQNGDHTYPQTGRTANQITTLNAVNVLSPPVAANPPAYANPADTSRTLNGACARLPALELRQLPSPSGRDAGQHRPAPRHGACADRRLRRGANAPAISASPMPGSLRPVTTRVRYCLRACRPATRTRCRRSQAMSSMRPARS